jgi:hypothetical protein
MQTYQSLTDHVLLIPNIGLVPPRGAIETGLVRIMKADGSSQLASQ